MKQPTQPLSKQLSARVNVKAAEDVWNARDPERVLQAYSKDLQWNNRAEFYI
ncbi:MAG: DUF1348 family protein [bacterium]